ncbi:MAG: adenine deaminase [Desulfobacterales bacterium]|nr:adenine deaminase [Desulfobacterales bacterium]
MGLEKFSKNNEIIADILFTNGNIIDVYSGEIYQGSVAVTNGKITGLDECPAKKVIDLKGKFISPGFIDSHVHIESSMCSPTEFSKAVVPLGTTTVVADPHEIANVHGAEGINYMLESSKNQLLDIYYTLPSCVPATNMETSGGKLGSSDLYPFLKNRKVLGLGEMMDFPGVINGNKDILKKISDTLKFNKVVDGHAPGLTNSELSKYVSPGITSDHECTSAEEAIEKIRSGMFIMIREGTCAKNLDALFPIINDRNSWRLMWCTDDRHPDAILDDGHVNAVVRDAVKKGLDPVISIRLATAVPAEYFRLKNKGAIAPGKDADILIFSDLEHFVPDMVFAKGVLVSENNILKEEHSPVKNNDVIRPVMEIDPENLDFSIEATSESIRTIQIIKDQVITKELISKATIENGFAIADTKKDLVKIAVVERYTGKATTGLGFVNGFGLKKGAIASSVAHDSHNIVVIGTNDLDMREAVINIVGTGGGFAVANDGIVRYNLPLPLGGLMSLEPMEKVRKDFGELIDITATLGSNLYDPFITLGFLSLPVIPKLKITDHGLVDVEKFETVSLFV